MWVVGGFNRSANTANLGRLSPYQVFTGKIPYLQLVPFLQPGVMRVTRLSKADVQRSRTSSC